MTARNKTIFVAMSGGVDSSVAAALLKQQGANAVGVFMRCVNLDGCAERDAEDARRAAERLDIPFYVFDLEEDYRRHVVDYMIKGYRKGITPNPDVMCNKEIKFGLFLQRALALGANGIATGHYVRLARRNGQPVLKVARDANKDQSYFLWTLTEDVLRHCHFPIGDYTKPEVRRMAKRFGLPTAEKKDSQGICFLGNISLRDFLGTHLPEREGAVVTVAGEAVGTHRGAWFTTVGQRHIGVANHRILRGPAKGGGRAKPLYVVKKDVSENILTVAEGSENHALYRKEINLRDVNFLTHDKGLMTNDIPVLARVRYRQPLAKATLSRRKSLAVSHKLVFAVPQKFVAPGQSAVFYAKDGAMLGGGVIA